MEDSRIGRAAFRSYFWIAGVALLFCGPLVLALVVPIAVTPTVVAKPWGFDPVATAIEDPVPIQPERLGGEATAMSFGVVRIRAAWSDGEPAGEFGAIVWMPSGIKNGSKVYVRAAEVLHDPSARGSYTFFAEPVPITASAQ